MATTAEETVAPRRAAQAVPALSRLRDVAESIPDQAFGGRLWKIYESGASAIAALGYLELSKYEDYSEEASADLSMWEEVAPVISKTLMEVNRLLAAVRELFPARDEGRIGELIGEAIGEGGEQEALLQRKEEEATRQIQLLADVLASNISELGGRVRSPQVVSDRWNLLADLQEFRGKFREAIGDMIYLTASAFAPMSRTEVVPGFADDVREAVSARRSVTDLGRLMAVYSARVRAAAPAERPETVAALTRDFDAFGRSRAYGVLRSVDKRRFVEFRSLLRRSPSDPGLDVAVAVEDFAAFTQSLSHINKRTCLQEHDRELLAACSVKLENVELARVKRPLESAALLSEAIRDAAELYGRDPSLDAYLRKAKKRDLAALDGTELGAEVELVRELFVGTVDS